LLDAGSGHGAWADLFSGKGYSVVGVDLSHRRMKLANERRTNETVTYLAGDLLNTPFKNQSFNVSFCSYVLHHFRRMEQILAELSRVTHRGGELLVTEPNGSNVIYRLTEFSKRFAPRKWMLAKGIDSTNETIHSSKYYIDSLEAQGIKKLKIIYVNSRQLECRFDGKTVTSFLEEYGLPIGSIMLIRMLLFKAVSRIATSTLSCDQIIIHAQVP
jgi:ubiquinone/menaquinone biosynthesis C-methylase UbiE